MSFYVSWTIEGDKQLSRVLTRMSTDVKDFRFPLNKIAENLKDLFAGEVFSSKGAVIGERWPGLKASTIAQKRRRGFSSEPLVATGAMQAGFRSIVTSDQAVIYNTQDYFKYHQSNQPRSRLPRRAMMKIANLQKEMIVKEFQNYIMAHNRNV